MNKALPLLIAVLMIGCNSKRSSFEEGYRYRMDLVFPKGHKTTLASKYSDPIEKFLKDRSIGFLSGYMNDGTDIQCISFDVKFDEKEAKKLIDHFVANKTLPQEIVLEFHSY